MSKLEELKAAYEAATKGEWEDYPAANGDSDPMDYRIDVPEHFGPYRDLLAAWVGDEHDARFIALAHNLMPLLLEAVHLLDKFYDEALHHAESQVLGQPDFIAAKNLLEKLK